VAAVQDGSVDGDVTANVERHVGWIERAADDGAVLVVFPELSVTGYDPDLIDLHRMRVDVTDARLDPIRAACRRRRLHALIGAPVGPAAPNGASNGAPFGAVPPRIGVLHVSPTGAVAAAYHKCHLDTGEIGIFAAGTAPGLIDIDGWRIGLAVGRDASVPGHAEQLIGMGADVYAVAALFRLGSDERMAAQMAATAVRGLWVVLSQYCGATGGGPACGRSGVWSPGGEAQLRLGTAPGLAVVDVVDVADAEAGTAGH
jgi:predicted amidohydrolase